MKTWQQSLLLLLAGMLLAAGMILAADRPRGTEVELKPLPSAAPLQVDIGGAVRSPGIYTLPPGSRVESALEAAGGLLPIADRDQVNLAALLKDGDMLRIPAVGDPAQTRPTVSALNGSRTTSLEAELRINLNTATLEEFLLLPGIGETRARAILEYRTAHQGFLSVDEIQNVPGIGDDTYKRIKDLLFLK